MRLYEHRHISKKPTAKVTAAEWAIYRKNRAFRRTQSTHNTVKCAATLAAGRGFWSGVRFGTMCIADACTRSWKGLWPCLNRVVRFGSNDSGTRATLLNRRRSRQQRRFLRTAVAGAIPKIHNLQRHAIEHAKDSAYDYFWHAMGHPQGKHTQLRAQDCA